MEKSSRGYLYAIIASFTVAAAFVLNGIVVESVNPLTAAAYLSIFSTTLASAYILFVARKKKLVNLRKYWKEMLQLGFLSGTALILWFISLSLLGATVLGFLMRFVTVYIIILGVVFLKERFNRYEALGIFIIIVGALLMSYNGGELVIGAIVAIISSFFFAFLQFKSKVYVKNIDPFVLNSFRIIFAFPFIVSFSFLSGGLVLIPWELASLVFVVAVLTAMIGMGLTFKAYSLAKLSNVAALTAIQPLIILAYMFLLFAAIPTENQLIGGAIILVGTFLLIFSRKKPKIPIIDEPE